MLPKNFIQDGKTFLNSSGGWVNPPEGHDGTGLVSLMLEDLSEVEMAQLRHLASVHNATIEDVLLGVLHLALRAIPASVFNPEIIDGELWKKEIDGVDTGIYLSIYLASLRDNIPQSEIDAFDHLIGDINLNL